MCTEIWFWPIFPIFFIGMMILCMIFFGRRRRWSCCSPYDSRDDYRERIRKLEDEMEKLKGK